MTCNSTAYVSTGFEGLLAVMAVTLPCDYGYRNPSQMST